ncbi:MAG: GntR family transcriptional regulator [Anaerolineales bacterium]
MLEQPYKQLNEQVADKLRELIHDGKIKPGEWLRQEHLAQAVGVSPTPFREAIKALVAEGILEHLPYRGVRVIQFSAQDIEDIYAVRAYLESRAAGEAAEKISAQELENLRALEGELNAHLAPQEIQHYREINLRFHQNIYNASRRPYLIRSLNQLWALSPSMLWANFASTAKQPLEARTAADPDEHRAILAALEAHDAPAAEKAMRKHIEAAGRHLLEAIRK